LTSRHIHVEKEGGCTLDARKVGSSARPNDKDAAGLRAVILPSFVEPHIVGEARVGAFKRADH
jgi:hypothetical protein